MKHIVQLSGGKDSTAMLLMMLERNMPVDEIIFCDTGMEFPELYSHIAVVEKYIGRSVTVLRAEHSFEYYLYEHAITKGKNTGLHGYGWPAMFNRWCTNRLKVMPTRQYLKSAGDYTLYIGIAYDEPERHKNIAANVRHPLYDWGITEIQALEYCRKHGFTWGGLYDRFRRLGCWCCPLQRLSELRKVRKYYPELWQRLLKMDEYVQRQCATKILNFKDGIKVADLERKFALEDAQGCLWGDDVNGQ